MSNLKLLQKQFASALSPEEIYKVAKEHNINISLEQAKYAFNLINSKNAITDDQLNKLSSSFGNYHMLTSINR